MPYDADVLAVWVVSFLVVVSVAWLALHGWRQGRTLRRWAAGRGLSSRPSGDARAAGRLRAFRRDDEHLVRELDRVREVVALEHGGCIVRCEERLDLTPWTSGTGPPRTRVAAVFPAPDDLETYSVFDESGRPTRDRAPGLRFSGGAACRKLEARLPDPPHPVSITLADGWGLAYLLTPSGAVSDEELDYLARLSRSVAADGTDPEQPPDREAGVGGEAPGHDARRGPADRRGRPDAAGRPAARRAVDGG